MHPFQIEWRCSDKDNGLQVFVDDTEVFVTVGNKNTSNHFAFALNYV